MIQENNYFTDTNTFIQNLDPRISIIITILFSFIVSVLTDSLAILAALIFPLIFLCFEKLDKKLILKRLLLANFFILFIIIFLPFSYKGKILFKIYNLSYTLDGLKISLLIALKSNAIILFFLIFLSTSDILQLIHGLRHLYVPDKIVVLFYFFYRYIFEFQKEFMKLKNALKLRGFEAKTNIHTYRTYAYILGILLIKAYDKSERIYNAMILRCFNGEFWMYKHFHFRRKDLIFCIFAVMYIGLIGAMQWIKF